jgi:DNA-binding response OmpR family regulator
MPAGLDILLIEDSEALSRNIADYMEGRGHRLDFASDGRAGLDLAIEGHFNVIVLDLALPGMDGLALCEALRGRASRHVPVLMLTARDTLDDKLRGFAAGADDYLTKPFALAELDARCHALSQRHRLGADHVITIGSLEIDRQRGIARRQGQDLRLTPIAYRILLLVAEAHPRPLPRFELSRGLWGEDPPDSDALRSHVHLLRQVIDKPFDRPMLETVHGIGFRLRADSQ